jgi:hypothetical protein
MGAARSSRRRAALAAAFARACGRRRGGTLGHRRCGGRFGGHAGVARRGRSRRRVRRSARPASGVPRSGVRRRLIWWIGAPEARIVIGVVSGDSPAAYAVPVARGKTQWSIDDEERLWSFANPPRAVLQRPDAATALPGGRTEISFFASADRPGSNYPNAELWIDSRHVDGRLDIPPFDPEGERFDTERIRWIGAARLLPGRHVMVAGVKGDGGISANAWVLTVR